MEPASKHWYRSRTIWGAVVAIGAVVIGRTTGVVLSDEQQAELVRMITDALAMLGGAVAIYGRSVASRAIK